MVRPIGPELSSSEGFPFSLSIVDGRGVLKLSARRGAGPARLDRLELDIPDLRFPFDLSGGIGRFRHKRCRISEARLLFPEQEVLHWLLERSDTAGFGYSCLQLRAAGGMLQLAGEANLGDQIADFVLRAFIQPEGARLVRIALTDLRVYGTFPVPAPLMASALMRALGAVRGGRGARLVGCADVVIDPLRLLLIRTMVVAGWRLPSLREIRLLETRVEPGKLLLDFSSSRGTGSQSQIPALQRCLALQEAKARFLACEEAILENGPRVAADMFRHELQQNPGHPFLLERLLQLLCADPDAEDEVLQLCQHCRTFEPDFPPALLAEAAVLSRRGERDAAAASYRHLADRARREADSLEELLAMLAAARLALGGDRDRARQDFERVLSIEAEHEQALSNLAPLYAAAGEWDRLITIRQRQITSAATPEARLHGYVALGEIYRVHLADPRRAREHYQQALVIDPRWEPALRGLAEACIDAEDSLGAVRALDRLCELVAEQKDIDAEVALHLRIAAIWEHLQDLQSAHARLQRAMALRPDDPQVLRRTIAVALAQGRRAAPRRLEYAAELLSRLLAVLTDPAARQEAYCQLADLWSQLDHLENASLALQQALTLAPHDVAALRIAADLAGRSGKVEELSRALKQLATVEPDPAARSELWVKRGRLLLESGATAAEIMECFQLAADSMPTGATARRELAALHAREGEWTEARRCWQEVLAAGADDAECWNGLGLACLRLGDRPRAEEALQSALDRAANADAERRALLGLWELRHGNDTPGALVDIISRLLPLLDPIVDGEVRIKLLTGLAEAHQACGNLDAAAEALGQASALAPSDLELIDKLAQLEEERQSWDSARTVLERILNLIGEEPESGSRRAGVCERVGRAAEQQGRVREATDFYRRALECNPPASDADRIWTRLVNLHTDRDDPAAAARAAESWAAAQPAGESRAERLFFAAQIWLKRANQVDEALRCLQAVLTEQPYHSGALDTLEGIFTERGDRPALVEVLKTKVGSAARRPAIQKAVLARLGDLLTELGCRDEARTAFSSALALDSDYVPALIHLARDAFQQQELERAEVYYRRLEEGLGAVDPGDPDRSNLRVEVHLRLAELAGCRSQPAEEEAHLQQVLVVDPRQRLALERLDRLLSEQKRDAELCEVLYRRAAIAADVDAAVALEFRRADLLDRLPGRRQEAAEVLQHVLSLSPDCLEALQRLEQILRESGSLAELVSVLERRAELATTAAGDQASLQESTSTPPLTGGDLPRPPNTQHDAQRNIARDLFREAAQLATVAMNQPERAAALFRRAISCAPSDASLLLGLLELLGNDNNSEEIDELLRRLAELTSDPRARGNLELRLAERLEARGQASAALELVSRCLEEGRGGPEALLAAAQMRESTGDGSAAIDLYQQCVELCQQLHRRRNAGEVEDGSATPGKLADPSEAGLESIEARALQGILPLLVKHGREATRIEAAANHLLELRPGAPAAASALADLYQGRGEWASLVVVLEGLLAKARDASAAASEEFRLATRLALALSRSGRADQTGELLETCLKLAHQDVALYSPLLELAQELGLADLERRCREQADSAAETTAAEEQEARAETDSSRRTERLAALASRWLDLGDAKRAQACAIAVVQAAPVERSLQQRTQRVLLATADLQQRVGVIEEAEAALAAVAELGGEDVIPALERASELARTRHDLSAEVGYLGRLLRHRRNDASLAARLTEACQQAEATTIHAVVDCLTSAEAWEELCVLLEEKLATSEFDAELRADLAVRLGETYLDRLNDRKAGVRWLTAACSLTPVHTDECFQRLLALHRQRQEHAETAELIAQRLEQLPLGDRGPLWRELGCVLEVHLKDAKGAAQAFAAAFREEPDAGLAELQHIHNLYVSVGELSAALAIVEEALARVDPSERPTLLTMRAHVLGLQGHLEAATAELEQAIGLDSHCYPAHAELGRLRVAQQNFEAALNHLQQAAEHLGDPGEAAECMLLAGGALEKSSSPDQALAWYERAAAHHPLAPFRASVLSRAAVVQRDLGREAMALESCRKALELDPENADALELASVLEVQKREVTVERVVTLEDSQVATPSAPPPSAKTTVPTSVARISGNPSAAGLADGEDWWAAAQSYRMRASQPELHPTERAELLLCAARTLEEKLSRTLEALSVYEEATAVAPEYLPALEALADAAYRHQDWHRARDLYDRIWQDEQQRQRVELCYRRALIYEALGDESVADECYARAVALQPVHRPALEGRARLALFRDDVDVALQTLSALERLITVQELELLADLRQRLGKLYMKKGDLARAKQYLQASLDLEPERIKTIQTLLQVSERLEDFHSILELLQRMICLTTDPVVKASLLHHRAEILGGRLGDEVAAIDNLLKAYDLAPQYPPTLWRLVDYYWEQRDLASVAEMGEQLMEAGAVDQQPDLRQVRLAAAAVRSGSDLQKGVQLLKAALLGKDLHEPAILELAQASTLGAPVEALAELVRRVDENGQVRTLAKQLLLMQPDAPGLATLVRALEVAAPF